MLFWKFLELASVSSIALFQSLFCWMLFWKPFIWISVSGLTWFQSLFCWMLFWKFLSIEAIDTSDRGFNPYFVGCYSGSRFVNLWLCILLCFNPYFVGCYSGRKFCNPYLIKALSFQSLFCWMLFWKSGFP